jgi:flagellar assembly factor FliW
MTTATLTATDVPVLSLVNELPGFPGRRRFVLMSVAGADTFYVLTCLEDEALRFLVVPAALFFPNYAPEIDDESARLLELTSAEDALLYLMVNVGERVEDSTVNLMAPLVINQVTLAAAQVVLSGSDYPLQEPLSRR